MNYRHIYHAGNFADCLKHIVLTRILSYLQKKDKPYFALDTHAGIGLYDLSSTEAQKTGEWQEGIRRLIGEDAAPIPANVEALCEDYFSILKKLNPEGGLQVYPGSPKIIQEMARPKDRALLVEKHPEDAEMLDIKCGRDRQSHIKQGDGWVSLRSDLPPPERRGVVLIDPPFEEPDEYTRMVTEFLKGYKRWSTGIYCLWYPIKARREVDRAAEILAEANIDNVLRAELVIQKLDTAKRLNGAGLFIINPPYTLQSELEILMPFLAHRLGQTARRDNLEWISAPK